MSRFGDLLSGNATPTPSPEPVVEETVEITESPILDEDTTNYDEVIEEELGEVSEEESYDILKGVDIFRENWNSIKDSL